MPFLIHAYLKVKFATGEKCKLMQQFNMKDKKMMMNKKCRKAVNFADSSRETREPEDAGSH